MDIREMKYIEMIAHTKSLTKAAQKLHISQPALYKSLRKVESEYNTTFFYRKGHESLPTDTGLIVLEYIRRTLESLEEMQENKAPEGKGKKEKKSMPLVLQFVLLILMVVVLRNAIGTVLVKGSSMEPNFTHGDLVFINKLSTSIGTPDYGDVVICKLDEGSGYENIIKRVIGLPGDAIVILDNGKGSCNLYRNGELVEETFLREPMTSMGNITYPFLVPENSYFVMGDNRNESLDSRRESVGAIEKKDLMGKVVLRLYPFSKFGPIE